MAALHGNLAGLPNDRVQVEVRQALPRGKAPRAGVAEDENFHAV
jgi:hypothetical protein